MLLRRDRKLRVSCVLASGLAFSSVAAGFEVTVQAQDASAPSAQQNRLSEADVLTLIEGLGSPDFQEREQSLAALIAAGDIAQPILEKNARHPNLEVRLRIVDALSEIRLQDVERRLKLFLEGGDGVELQLPMWTQWAEFVGDQEDSRALYAEMARDQWQFLSYAAEADSVDLTTRVNEAFLMHARTGQSMSVPMFSGLVFLGSLNETADNQVISSVFSLVRQEAIRRAIERGRYSPPLSAMLNKLLLKAEPNYISLVLQMAIELKLDCGREKALEVLKNFQQSAERQVQPALLALVQLGSKDDLPVIESLFDDRRTLRIILNNEQRDSEVRDFALAVALAIAGEDLTKYKLHATPFEDPKQWPLHTSVWFTTGEEREAAFALWSERRSQFITP